MKRIFSTLLWVAIPFLASSQVSYTWNGLINSNWNNPLNWTPSGTPAAADNVTIVAALNNCTLNSNSSVTNVSINSGTFDLGGFTLICSGVFSSAGGNCNNGTLSLTGTSQTFSGVTFGANISVVPATTNDVYFNGCTFNGTLNVARNNTSNIQSTGNNTFNGSTTIVNAGSGYLLLTNSAARTETFNAASNFGNTGTGNLYIGYSGNVTFNSAPTVNNITNSGDVYFGGNTGTITLAAGVGINTAATSGTGLLRLYKLVQSNATALNLNVGSTAGVYFNNSTILGPVTVTAGNIYTGGTSFASTVTFNKTGGTNNAMPGNNTFNGTLTLNHSGSGYWGFGNGTRDVFNGDVYLNNTCNNERILIGQNSTMNQFNGNVYVSASGTAGNIWLGWGGTSPIVKMAAGKTVAVNGAFSAGGVVFNQFEQSDATPITLAGTGTSLIQMQGGTIFTGATDFTAADIYVRGATFNAPTVLTKTGGTNNHNNSIQNIFNSNCTINQQSNTGYFMLSYQSADQFNGNITVTSTGSGGIHLGWPNAASTPVLAAGKTIQVGTAGFSAGFLYLGGFTQLGNAPVNLSFTGASTYFRVNNNTVIGGNISVTSPSIYLDGATFSGTSSFSKTGSNSDGSTGGNIFTGACTIANSGAGYFLLGNGTADTWNGDVTFSNSGSDRILPAYTSTGNQFNGNIILNSTGSSVGINIGANNGSATQAAGQSISVGGSGFSSGYLIFQRFTQAGNSPVNLTLSSTANYIQFGPSSTFNGNITSSSPGLIFSGSTFNGTINSTKTGATSDQSSGNTFNGVTTMANTGSGYLMFGTGTPDTWNADVTFSNSGTERILPAWSSAGNMFNGNITVNNTGSGLGINFCGNAAGTATLAAGKTIAIGATGFNTGYLILPRFTQVGNTPTNLTLTGSTTYIYLGPSSTFGGDVTIVSPRILLGGTTFSQNATFTKNGATGEWSPGGNTYNGTTTINHTGAGFFGFCQSNPDIFNGDVYTNNNGTERIIFANSSIGNQFNGNITCTQIGSSVGTVIGYGGSCDITMAAGKTIFIGAGGFNVGYLTIQRFTQLGSTAMNLTLTGTGVLNLGTASTFGGVVNATAPDIWPNGATYNSAVVFTKTGGANNHNQGLLNTFNSTVTINNQSNTGYFMLGYNSADYFSDNITVTSTGSGGINLGYVNGSGTPTLAAGKTVLIGAAGFSAGYLRFGSFTQLGNAAINLTLTGTSYLIFSYANSNSVFGGAFTGTAPDIYVQGATFNSPANFTKNGGTNNHNSGVQNIFNSTCTLNQQSNGGYFMLGYNSNDLFNDDITVTSSGSGGIYLGYSSGTGTPTLAAGKTILVGGAGFSTGFLYFGTFTQLGNAAVNLSFTGTTTNLTFARSSVFGGNVTTSTPSVLFSGCTFSGTTNCTKTGSPNDVGSGSNVFTGVSTITNSGTGALYFGNGSRDQWLADATFNNTGSSITYVAHNAANNTFAGNVTCSNNGSTGNSTGIYFCNSASATATISGNLIISNNPTSGTNNGLRFAEGNNSIFNVNGTTTITNTGVNSANYIRFAQGTGSSTTFNGDVTVTNTGNAGGSTNVIHFGYTGSSAFNGNITLNSSTGTGTFGIYFGANNGTNTQADNKTINTGTYTAGQLFLRNFTQSGPTSGNTSNVSITGTNYLLQLRSCSFYDNVTGSSQEIDVLNNTFRGAAALTKTGGNANDTWSGGNTFNGTTTITNQSAGFALNVANTTADAYNGNVTFTQSSTGALRPNYVANCTYAANITVAAPAATTMTFGSNGGTATMSGGNAQTINLTSGNYPTFTNFVMNKSGNSVTLNTRINISTALTMTSGNILTTSTNILNMNNSATTTVGSTASYIDGPMNYDMALNGARTLNFPIGKSADWRPAILALTHNAATSYTYKAEVFNASADNLGWTLPPTVDTVSGVHYWDIDRSVTNGAASSATNLSGNQTITLYFDVNDAVYEGSNLTICKNTNAAPTTWIDIGGNCALGNSTTPQAGSISSTSAPSPFNSFSRFTLGSKLTGWNSLPVEFLAFNAKPVGSTVQLKWSTATETNNAYFEVERSNDGKVYEHVTNVKAHGDGNSLNTQLYDASDLDPYSGISYYRLKQVDKNGSFRYSNIATVNFTKRSFVNVYPNPATSYLTIEASNDYVNTQAQIMNTLGEELLNTSISANGDQLNISSLPSGIYYIVIDNGTEPNRIKITIQK